MKNVEIRGLMELSSRLHRDTQRACEQSRASRQDVLQALSKFKREVGLSDSGCGCDLPHLTIRHDQPSLHGH